MADNAMINANWTHLDYHIWSDRVTLLRTYSFYLKILFMQEGQVQTFFQKLEFWHKNLWKKKYAERHLTCRDMFFWSFFQIIYLNEKKRSRIALVPLLPTRPRAPSVMESGSLILAVFLWTLRSICSADNSRDPI